MAPKRIPRPARIDPPNFKKDAYDTGLALAWNLVPNIQLNGARSVLRHLNKIRSITAITDKPALKHLSFLFTDPDIEKRTATEVWEPVRCIGNGSFGRVGLWQRRDKNGDILDEVAIKEAKKDHEVDGYPGLAREAAIQRDLNTSAAGRKRMNVLRHFKYNPANRTYPYRFYTTFAPHGDLLDLILRYRIFDQFLPALFVYDCLIQLCEAVSVLERNPPKDTVSHLFGERKSCFALHLDIKPSNVLLDYAPRPSNNDIQAFPQLVLADFGNSRYTDGEQNSAGLGIAGTQGYAAPERHLQQLGLPGVGPNGIWKQSLNVWEVGRVMLDVMMLIEDENVFDALLKKSSRNPELLAQNEDHFLRRDWDCLFLEHVSRATYHAFPYSQDLMDLVRRCLRIDPEERPSIKEVLKDAKRLKKTHVDELREKYDKPLKRKRRKAVFTTRKRTRRATPSAEPAVTNKRVVSRRRKEYHDDLDELDDVVGRQWDPEWQRPKDSETLDEATRLYFVKHEINNMRRGHAAFPRTEYLAEVYSVILEHGQDPDWPPLRGPVFAWGDLWTNTPAQNAQKMHPMRQPAPQPPSPHRPPARRTDYEALFMKELTDLYAERFGLGYLQAELVTTKRGMTKDQLIDVLLARDAEEPRGKHPHKVLEERFPND